MAAKVRAPAVLIFSDVLARNKSPIELLKLKINSFVEIYFFDPEKLPEGTRHVKKCRDQ